MKHTFRNLIMRTIGIWAAVNVAGITPFLLFSAEYSFAVSIVRSLGCFLTVLVYYTVVSGRQLEGRRMGLIYLTFFSVQIVFGVASSFEMSAAMEFYVAQYSNIVYLGFLLSVCSHILMGMVLRSTTFAKRLIVTTILVAGLIGGMFLPYMLSARYLYTVPAVTDFRMVDRAKGQMAAEGIDNPTAAEIAERVVLSEWKGSHRVGELSGTREAERIAELLPYTVGDDYVALINGLFYETYSSIVFICVFFLAMFFVLNYIFDPPSAPHFEKIHGALLIYCVLEGIHAIALSRATTFQELADLDRVGKYATAIVLSAFIGLFAWRLKFLTRGEGDFYEGRLERDPGSISRWRDGIDEIIIRRFFSKQQLSRRFVLRRARHGG